MTKQDQRDLRACYERIAQGVDLETFIKADTFTRERAITIFSQAGAGKQEARLLAGFLSLGVMYFAANKKADEAADWN